MTDQNSRTHSRVLPPPAVPGLLRRRALTLASTAAALSLGGCGFMGDMGKAENPYILEADSRPVVLTKQQEVAKQATEFAASLETAKKPDAPTALAAADPHKSAPIILANSAPAAGPSGPTPPSTPPVPAAEPAKTPEPRTTAESPKTPLAPTPPAPAPAPMPTSSSVNSATPVPSATITPIATPREPVVPTAMTSAVAMATPPSTPAATANTANITTPSAANSADPTLAQALDILRKQVAAKPSLSTALALALLDSTASKTPDSGPAKDLSPADQKLYGDLLTALQTMPAAAPATTIADRAAPLVAAAKKWEADADISLPKLILASRVDSYGVYSPVEAKFETGQRHTVIIYCEVANFASKKSDDGWFQTRLSQQETLITEDGLLVWRPNAEEVEDRSMNQRRDFYLVKKLTIPENLAVGKYTLRMSVTDKNTNKIAMVAIPIEVVAK